MNRLQREINAVINAPDIKERLASPGITGSGNTPAEFGRKIRVDLKKYTTTAGEASIRID